MSILNVQNEPYILCYFLGSNEDNWSHVYKLSKKTGIPLRIIPVFRKDYKRGDDLEEGVGPGEFLSLVKNASMVCTDSFHGTVFSIIYNRPFFTYERFSSTDSNNQNSRIYNILTMLGLRDRLVSDPKSGSVAPLVCNFSNANMQLKKKREESFSFLEKALSSAVNDRSPYAYQITNTCSGCGVCSLVCPTSAIDIRRDEKGFLRSFVDQEKCIRCEKCRTVCPFVEQKAVQINEDVHNLYMLQSVDTSVLSSSSSGGAGFEIGKTLSMDRYDVIGCVYDKRNGEAVHRLARAGDLKALEDFKGSKYLQSNTRDAFKDCVERTEKAVVFGTPCQIAGLDLLLKSNKKRDKYVLVDLICHGVPSQHLWNKYLREGSRRYGYGSSPDVKFRDKSKGWRDKFIRIEGNGRTFIRNENKDLFYRFFLLRHSIMEACYECNYRTNSSADLRIGDFWGPRYKKNKDGVSMVIAMTEIGEKLLDQLKADNKVELKRHRGSEFWTVQYPQNPVKPVFYEELISELRDDSKPLGETANLFCSTFEFHRKLRKSLQPVISLIKRGMK